MTTTLAPCPTEDSTNCFWDATNVGNRQGDGFVDINGVLFPLVNEPEWNVNVTAVHYDCDDFTLAECQPYADYDGVSSDPAPEPTTAEEIYEQATTPYIDTLPATGLDDFSPGLLSIAMILILGGLALKKLAAR